MEFVFNAEQAATYNQVVQTGTTEDFELYIRVGDAGLTPANAHLRGQSSLWCDRLSYTIELEGAGRHLFPDSRTDEFYLISMCNDDRYIQTYTANQILTQLGLFDLRHRYVELKVSGGTHGVYLLMEKMREELVRDHSRVQTVMRRRYTGSGPSFATTFMETKYGDPTLGLDALYKSVSTDLAAMPQHMDVDQYLRFLALMTAYQNGDHVDEIFVTGVEQTPPGGPPSTWFSITAWDNDDLFSDCHNSGSFAYADPNELVYCAEADTDYMLMADPEMYARYVDILEDLLLNRVTPADFEAAVQNTSDALMPLLAKPGISAAMVEMLEDNPAAADPDVAQADVQAHLDELVANYTARHALLLERIDTYRNQ
jgi:hypothetical protein